MEKAFRIRLMNRLGSLTRGSGCIVSFSIAESTFGAGKKLVGETFAMISGWA